MNQSQAEKIAAQHADAQIALLKLIDDYAQSYAMGGIHATWSTRQMVVDAVHAIVPPSAGNPQPSDAPQQGAERSMARRLLWLAFCWNDHNFGPAHEEARKEAAKHGIKNQDDADAWLTQQPQPAEQQPTQLGYTLTDVHDAYSRGKAAGKQGEDAARLDWLEANASPSWGGDYKVWAARWVAGVPIRAAIDAVRAAQGQK